jgi:FkbM family methyltransferase
LGVIEIVRNKGKHLTLLKPLLLRGYHVVQWLHHFRRPVVRVVDGIRYELDLNQIIDSSIYFLGEFEPHSAAAIRKFIRPGNIVLDIGANVGCHALLFSKLVGPDGRVIAFEPTDWAFRKLVRNKELNVDLCPQNLVLEKIAIAGHSRKSERVKFRSSWRLFGPQEEPEPQLVDISTVDDYLEASATMKVDFIKVDVDGYEYKVIKGALKTLQTHKPVLMLELGHNSLEGVGDQLEALVDCLFSLGYTIRWDKELYLFRNRSEILTIVPPDSTINVICLPELGASNQSKGLYQEASTRR